LEDLGVHRRIILKCILKMLNGRARASADDTDTIVCCASRTDDFLGGVSNLSTISCSLSVLCVCLLSVLSLSRMKNVRNFSGILSFSGYVHQQKIILNLQLNFSQIRYFSTEIYRSDTTRCSNGIPIAI
jgi:hypothetical protein